VCAVAVGWRSWSRLRQRRGDWVVHTSRRRRPCSFSGEEEGAAQQPGVDGGQHAVPVGLSLRERAGRFQPGELLSIRFAIGQPGRAGGGEGGGGAGAVSGGKGARGGTRAGGPPPTHDWVKTERPPDCRRRCQLSARKTWAAINTARRCG